ncbi:DUF1801 domain-containing protein [Histidinibacterium lentulum]|uniref:DUF1801 domain-containing protein n=1 Tax=Histidinibacterium lentulum TaxID=2480588 RepID=A0A3N2R7X4_9RHOB|nr:DUF1801 domain-containing protein [Histidinibacterium lentulum]ROU03518.1 DUF1801 domain-containing protein [Histidinibacterium lentulum]
MTGNVTRPTGADVAAFLEAVEHPVRRTDGLALDRLFRRVTGWTPRLWGASLVGYGSYRYTYESGREGDMLATGFSPRKAALSIYVMPGYARMDDLLARLGKHRMGKACLHVTKLSDIDMDVLEAILRRGLEDLAARYPVTPS